MNETMPPSAIRTRFDIPRTANIIPLGAAGGFSGAKFWQVETIDEVFCLRRWPKEHPDRDRLEWIHRVMQHVTINGCAAVEQLQPTRENAGGGTYLEYDGFFWQLTEWMPGEADFCNEPSESRLANAMETLARFHMAAAQVNLDFGHSSNIKSRFDMLQRFDDSMGKIVHANPFAAGTGNAEAASHIHSLQQLVTEKGPAIASRLKTALEPFCSAALPLQPVIRDVWHDHILFTGDRVTGLVDFGAMEMDTVALDVSRLLGSLVGDDTDRWQAAIESYAGLRPLTEQELDLIPLLDQSGILLGGINWLIWILIEGRTFENWDAVGKRVSWINSRLAAND